MSRKAEIDKQFTEAETEYQAKRSHGDSKTREAARRRRNSAQMVSLTNKERTKDELKALMMLVRKWADEKEENRRGWCQALHTVVCGGRSKGSLLWQTFPQEAIDMIAEETGSRPVQVAAPELVDGEIEFDGEGRVLLVERVGVGKPRQHQVLIPEMLEMVLRDHLESSSFQGPEDFLFHKDDGSPVDPDVFRSAVLYAALRQLGIPILRRASGFHMFRHTAASLINKETGNMKLSQAQLGHANVQLTADVQ
jgi:integrase